MYNEILPRLFLGNQADAAEFAEDEKDGIIICVLEQRPQNEPFKSFHIPILTSSGHVHTEQLNRLIPVIGAMIAYGRKVLVHCSAGVERSPLAVTWYLHKTMGISIEEAYKIVKEKRPEIADRSTWLVVDVK